MSTLFISDLHLDPKRPKVFELFETFLRRHTQGAEALYILGDFFEYWLGDDTPSAELHAVLDQLKQASQKGLAIYLQHGNRDFLLSAELLRRHGCQLLEEPSKINLYGTPTLIMHGDLLCSDDVKYQMLRHQVRDPRWQKGFLDKPLTERIAMAEMLREKSQQEKAKKSVEIMDVNAETVAETFQQQQVTWLIHGHTHRPAIHDYGSNGTKRIVLGEWREQGSYLRISADQEPELISFS